MKKLIYIAGIVLILITSCKKDFIELTPVSTISIDLLFKTDKDYKDAIIGCYNVLQTQYKDMYIFGDIRADDASKDIINTSSCYFADVFTLSSENPLLENTWQNYYSLIFRANKILLMLKDADPSIIVNKDLYFAETRFLRALAYFDLVRIFGNVPMILKPISVQESYEIGREDVDKIYNEVIIPDLLEAEKVLPLTYTGANIGRATQGAAKSLLGKVYLTNHDFEKAEAKLHEVTTMGYQLLTSYDDLFDYTKNEHHSEYIFDIEYISGGHGEGSPFTRLFIPMSLDYANFLNIIGAASGDSYLNVSVDLFNAFDPLDLRRSITADTTGGYVDGNGVFHQFVYREKFTHKYEVAIASGDDSPANWKVIRYADVLLMYAEALNENSKTVESLQYLNMVRARAGLEGYSGLSKDQTRDKIYLERRFELSFEGHRWFDLVRTGLAHNVMQSFNMQPYMTVFPIPLSQIQIVNDPTILNQNPGYE